MLAKEASTRLLFVRQPMSRSIRSFARGVLFFSVFLLSTGFTATAAEMVITVALDGSAQYKSVQEAIMAVPAGRPDNPVIIRIKPGTYRELIYVQHEKRFFHLVGENPEKTILTFDLYAAMIGPDGKPIGTFRTPSTYIGADDFTVENITFENTAGVRKQDGQ